MTQPSPTELQNSPGVMMPFQRSKSGCSSSAAHEALPSSSIAIKRTSLGAKWSSR
ncbi:MAG TPA: hypothetical protein VFS00_27915 [Polyangiaceae bacterium]|nr:hypothetical protein [Polyangiaceae bacterium]